MSFQARTGVKITGAPGTLTTRLADDLRKAIASGQYPPEAGCRAKPN